MVSNTKETFYFLASDVINGSLLLNVEAPRNKNIQAYARTKTGSKILDIIVKHLYAGALSLKFKNLPTDVSSISVVVVD